MKKVIQLKDVVKITDPDDIRKRWETVRNCYPRMLGRWVTALENNYATDAELCTYGYRGLFESTLRLVGWILASIYLQDKADTENSEQTVDNLVREIKDIGMQLESLNDPSLGKWKSLIEKILRYYFKQENRARFPVKDLLYSQFTVTGKDGARNQGYTHYYTENLKRIRPVDPEDLTKRMSVLTAGSLLRNAFSHLNVVDPTVFSDIRVYFQDILLQTFEAFSFLSAAPQKADTYRRQGGFQIVLADYEQGTGQVLHGPATRNIPLDGKGIDRSSDVQFYLHDVGQNIFYPLFPFLLKDNEQWQFYGELVLSRINLTSAASKRSGESAWLEYRSWNDEHGVPLEQDSPEYRTFWDAYESKKQSTKYDKLKSVDQFRKRALSLSLLTIRQYSGKYFPASYIRREGLRKEIDAFLEDPTTAVMLVTGDAGVGKSAWLCNTVDEWVASENPGLVPVFINAGNIFGSAEGQIDKTWGELLRRQFDIRKEEAVTSLMDFIQTLQELREKENGGDLPQVIFVLDALNESGRENLLFSSVSDVIRQCHDREKYGWLKFVVSSRKPYMELQRVLSQGKTSWSGHLGLFHNYQPQEFGAALVELPHVRIPSFSNEEILAAFSVMLKSGELPYLEEIPSPEELLRPHLNYLRTPLLVRFYSRLLDNRLARKKDLPGSFSKVIAAYYQELETNNDLGSCLSDICKVMVNARRNYLTIEEKDKLKQRWKGKFLNPFDYLEEEFILSEGFRIDEAGEVMAVSHFTYERFSEYAIAFYLKKKYKLEGVKGLSSIMAAGDFGNFYENAVSIYVQFIWQNEGNTNWTQLLEYIPERDDRNRYAAILVLALFEEWRDDYAFDEQAVSNWKLKIQSLLSNGAYFAKIPAFTALFHQKAAEFFEDRMNAVGLYDFCLDTAASLLWDEGSYEKNSFLVAYCRRLIDQGRVEEAEVHLSRLSDAIPDKMKDLEQNSLSRNAKKKYTIEYQKWVLLYIEYIQLRAESWLFSNLFVQAVKALGSASYFLEDILQNSDDVGDRTMMFTRKKAELHGLLGDLYYKQRDFEKAEQAYAVSGNMYTVKLNTEDPLEKAQLHNQKANNFEAKWGDELYQRAASLDYITIAIKNNPHSSRLQIYHIEYLLNFLEFWIDTGRLDDWIKVELENVRPIIDQFRKLKNSNITYLKLLVRYSYIHGMVEEFVNEDTKSAVCYYQESLDISGTLNVRTAENISLLFRVIDTNLGLLRLYYKKGNRNHVILYYGNAVSLIEALAKSKTDGSIDWQLGMYYYRLFEWSGEILLGAIRGRYINKAIRYFSEVISRNNAFLDAELYLSRSYSLWARKVLQEVPEIADHAFLFSNPVVNDKRDFRIRKILAEAGLLIRQSLRLKRKLFRHSSDYQNYIMFLIHLDEARKLQLLLWSNRHDPRRPARDIRAIALKKADSLRDAVAERCALPGRLSYSQRDDITTFFEIISEIYSYLGCPEEAHRCLQILHDFLEAPGKCFESYFHRSFKLRQQMAVVRLNETTNQGVNIDPVWKIIELLEEQCKSEPDSTDNRSIYARFVTRLFHVLWVAGERQTAVNVLMYGIQVLEQLPRRTKPQLHFYPGMKPVQKFNHMIVLVQRMAEGVILWWELVKLKALLQRFSRELRIRSKESIPSEE